MPNTPGGIPYPAPTDPVNQGAVNMAAVATYLDPAEVCLYRVEGANVNSGTWTSIGFTSTLWTVGAGVTSGGGGVAVSAPGRYRVEAFATFPGNSAGTRRGIAITGGGAVAVDSPTDHRPPCGSNLTQVSIATTVRMTAAGSILVYLYQDSTVILVANTVRLNVYRAP